MALVFVSTHRLVEEQEGVTFRVGSPEEKPVATGVGCVGIVLVRKNKTSFKRPFSSGGIRVASRAQTSSQCGNPLVACVYGRWPELCPGWVPVVQDLM